MTKIWHDDVRTPPDGWHWARTNAQAMDLLVNFRVDEISLDHDLGLDYIDPEVYEGRPEELWILAGTGKDTGLDLVNWMCDNKLVPKKVTIHSWNPVGAQNMAARLNYFGYDCVVKPFDPSERN